MAVNVDYVQAGGYSAIQARQGIAAILTRAGQLAARAGVLQSSSLDLQVQAQVTPNMTVKVLAGQVVIPDAGVGAYIFTNDATIASQTIVASDPTNPRIDLVIAQVFDNEAGDAAPTTNQTQPGSTAGTAPVQTYTGKIVVVQGTPGAIPAVPALPTTRCVVLKQVTVRAATTSILTSDIADTGRVGNTAASGGVVVAVNAADQATLLPHPGQLAYRQDLDSLILADGTASVFNSAVRIRQEITNTVNTSVSVAANATVTRASGTITPTGPCEIELDATVGVVIGASASLYVGNTFLYINNVLVRSLLWGNYSLNVPGFHYPSGKGRLYLPSSAGSAIAWRVDVANSNLSAGVVTACATSYAVREVR